MKKIVYLAGRSLQWMGLIAMPSAIWAGHFGHNERGAIGIFLGSSLIFFLGYFLCAWTGKR